MSVLTISGAINTSREGFSKMISTRNADAVLQEARFAAGCRAQWIGLNCSSHSETETEDLLWLCKTIQDEIELPLCIDSLNPVAVEAVLSVHRHGKPIVDALNCESARLDTFLPLLKKYDAYGICLLMQEGKMGMQVEDRINCIPVLQQKLAQYEVDETQILLDPLVFALSTGEEYATVFLETLKKVKKQYPNFLTCCGLDNISHGMPLREHINEVFLINCILAGIDSVRIIPTKTINSFLAIQDMIAGENDSSLEFISAYRDGFMA